MTKDSITVERIDKIWETVRDALREIDRVKAYVERLEITPEVAAFRINRAISSINRIAK